MVGKYEIRPGDRVTFSVWPEWVKEMAEDSQGVFAFAFGKHHRVREIDKHGLLVLEIQGADGIFGGSWHTIYLEPEFVTPSRKVRRRRSNWQRKCGLADELPGLTYSGNPSE